MAYCGVHFRKLKTASHIKKACSHDRRSHVPQNVNPDRVSQNITLLDHGRDRWEIINEKISQRVKRKVRDNAVRMVEAFVYTSPEYFRPNDPNERGTWDEKRLKPWAQSVYEWLLAEYGENNLLEAHLHLDEATPHIHAVILPITKDGRLTAKDYLMNRVGLRNAQSSLAKALAPLGLTRGLKGSGAKHIPADKWAVETQNCLAKLEKVPEPKSAGKMPFVQAGKHEALKKQYNKAIQNYEKATTIAVHVQTLEAENRQLKKVNSAYAMELDKLRPIAKQVRGIEIQEVIKNHDRANILSLDAKGRAISKREKKWRGRNAIDVVMHLNDCDYKTAVSWLFTRYQLNEVASSLLNSDPRYMTAIRNEIVQIHNETLVESKQQNLKKFDSGWRDRETNQRTYYVLYKRNIEPEVIQDFRVWENANGRFLKNTDRDYHIWDKGDRLILREADQADYKTAVRLIIKMAEDKGWDLKKTKATGPPQFLDEVKRQVDEHLLDKLTQPKARSMTPKMRG